METLIKKIKAKAYQGEYLIYCRKSTDDSENQKNSLGHQKRENLAFAKTYGLQIAQVTQEGFCTNGVISESHSGFKEDSDLTFTDNGSVQYKINRPKFNQLIQYLNEGYFAGIICMSWDRLSRNKTDNSIITKLIRRGLMLNLSPLLTTIQVLALFIWILTACSHNITPESPERK
jgi:site-specific DNA recombinase